jgi:hypothetical protein
MKKALSLAALGVAMATTAMAASNFDAWPQKTVITLNTSATGANVTSTQTNYPLLLRIVNPTIVGASGTNGAFLRFSTTDEVTEYSYEVEYSNNVDTAIVWVRIPSLAGNSTTQTFKIHAGNTGASSASSGPDVFRPADGWVGVWHMNKVITSATDTVKDATGNGLHAVPANTGLDFTFPMTTIVGPAYAGTGNTNAAGRYFNVVLSNTDTTLANGFLSTNAANLTLSAWASSSNCASGTRQSIIAKYNGTAPNLARQFNFGNAGSGSTWALAINPTQYGTDAGGSGVSEFVATRACNSYNNTVALVAGTYAGLPSAQTVAGAYSAERLYINGDSTATAGATGFSTASNNADVNRTAPLRIGAGGSVATANRFLLGAIDEARISNVARSADWNKLDYATQRSSGNVTVAFGTTVGILPSGKTQILTSPVSTRVAGNGVVFTVAENSAGVLKVLDVQGRTVWSREISAATREATWNSAGKGVYFARFTPKDAKVSYIDTKFSLVK